MKTIQLTALLLIVLLNVQAQKRLSSETFTKINIESSAKVIIKQDSACLVEYSEEKSKLYNSPVSVKNGTLNVSWTGGNDLIVSLPLLEEVTISGIGNVVTESPLKVDQLKIAIAGDGKIDLTLDAKKVDVSIAGVGKVVLKGMSQDADYSISGSGKIDASELKTIRSEVNISGLGKCLVDVEDELTINISGNGTVLYNKEPKKINENITGAGKVKLKSSDSEPCAGCDTTRLVFGKKQIWFIGDKDTLHTKKAKIKPIWVGFEMGINSFIDNGGSFTLEKGKSNFELRTEKSVSVALNLIQKNLELGKSNVWLFTGLGITWNNYRFENNVVLKNGSYINAIVDTNSNVKYLKSKLTTSYLTAPLMLEVFTSRDIKKAFHIGAGGIFGFRIGSHTKRKIEEDGNVTKIKDHDDYNLSPFRYGFRVAMGYGKFNLFADYYASTLFKNNKGPVLYPVNAGITFIGF